MFLRFGYKNSANNYQLLDEVEQNIVICQWRAVQITDLRDTNKSPYFAIAEFNNCFAIRSPSLFYQRFCSIRQLRSLSDILGNREQNNHSQQNNFVPLCAWPKLFVGSYLKVTWWALGQVLSAKCSRLSAKNASNDIASYTSKFRFNLCIY